MPSSQQTSGTNATVAPGKKPQPPRARKAADQHTGKTTARPVILIPQEPDDDSQRPWHRALQVWLLGPEGISLCVSAAVHATLFLVVGLVIYLLGLSLQEKAGRQGPINAFFTEREAEKIPDLEHIANIEFDLPVEPSKNMAVIDSSPTQDNSIFVPEFMPEDFGDEAALLPESPQNASDILSKAGDKSGKSWKKSGFAMPADKGKVITKGSFSVWTVPEDPEPNKSYMIVIQLNRRVRIRNLMADVTGTVKGTDGYFTGIGSSLKSFHIARQFVIPKARQIVIHIPGAKQLVKDVINIRSEKLDETQEIEIVF